MISWVEISSAWNAFFHAPESCAVQVIFRLTLGCLLTVNALLLFPLLRDFYATDSLWNLNAWKKFQSRRRMCLLHLLPETTGSFRILLMVHLLACVLFLIGYQFRIASIVVFVTLVSIHHRNSFILSSGDTVLRLMSFLMMFSNGADAVSLDAVHSTTVGFPQVDPWPTRLMQILLSTVYLRTVYWKLRGEMWWQGTAAWFPLWVDTFLRNRPPRWMLSPAMVKVATWGTLIQEVCLGTLVWIRELQVPVLVFGVVMHLIFDVILNLQLFSWVMAASLLLFLPPELAEEALQYFASCDMCDKSVVP